MIALAEPLRKAKLQKSHLDLELELLEHAAELVVKEEEGEDDSDDESSSDDCSESEDSEEEQADASAVTQREENTEKSTEVRPLEPGVSREVLKEDAVTDGKDVQLRSGDGEPREPGRMMEELGERLGEGLRIEEDVPRATQSVSRRNAEGESEGERDGHRCALGTEREDGKTATSRELLDVCLQKNPLRIVTTDGLDSDDEDLTGEYKGH